MKYTIKDLTEGRVAVKNDGTLEELKQVLNKAFPEDKWSIYGGSKYYLKAGISRVIWTGVNSTNLPVVSVKDLLKLKPVRGEKVFVSDDNMVYRTRIYLATVEGCFNPYLCVCGGYEGQFNDGRGFPTRGWKYIKRIEEPKEVQMTVAEIEEKLGISNLKITK